MSSPNVELVRSIFEAWEQGDWSSTEWADPDIQFVVVEGVQAGDFRGLAATAEAWRDFLRTWEGFRIEAEGFRELDRERVLVLVRRRGRGKISGLELAEVGDKGAGVMYVGGGRVKRLVLYSDRDRALADLGLAPEGV
jgi:hypothetical protein